MPRIARKYSTSMFKHIVVQGINKEKIFSKEKYIKKYKETMLKKLENSNVLILAYCIMNNHAHFLVYSEKNEYISKYMQKINIVYSQYYNTINNRVGYVFRDRYYSQDILTQRQLYNCLRYIHNNPVKANICKSAEQYKHSSYNEYLIKKRIINEESIKILLGTTENYKEDFLTIHNFGKIDEEFIDVKDKTIEEFMDEIKQRYNIKTIKDNKEILAEVIKSARKQTDITIMKLSSILGIGKTTIGKYVKNNQKCGN